MDPSFVARLVARSWLLPPACFLVLALAGLLLARRWPRVGTACAAAGVVTVLALSLPVVSDPLRSQVETYPRLEPARAAGAGAIVVLAGGVRNGPRPEPTPETLERMVAGVELARVTHLPLLFSGGVVVGGPPEAVTMQAALERSFGLRARWLETRSRTTAENAEFSAAMLADEGIHRIVLVTTANHMRRAVRDFEARGLEVVPAPSGVSALRYDGWVDWLPSSQTLARSCAALYEALGYWAPAPRPVAGAGGSTAASPGARTAAVPDGRAAQAPVATVR